MIKEGFEGLPLKKQVSMMIDGINRTLPAQTYFYQKDIIGPHHVPQIKPWHSHLASGYD